MPRSNWKGSISFGLVSIPVELYNTVDPSSGVSFKQINKKSGAKIKYKRIDAETEREVTWENIGKGFEYSKDVILPVGDDELKRVAGENARTIAIEEFVDIKNMDFIHVEHAYYLIPGKKSEKGYVILREALKNSKKIGIAKVIISTKEYLAAVSTYEDSLILYLMHYNNELRKLSEFDIPGNDLKKYKVTKSEIDVAKKLIQSMSEKWKPEKFKDEYREAVEHWVKNKIKHLPETKMQPRSKAKTATNMVNFVGLLKKSLKNKGKMPKGGGIPKRKTISRRTGARHHH